MVDIELEDLAENISKIEFYLRELLKIGINISEHLNLEKVCYTNECLETMVNRQYKLGKHGRYK